MERRLNYYDVLGIKIIFMCKYIDNEFFISCN